VQVKPNLLEAHYGRLFLMQHVMKLYRGDRGEDPRIQDPICRYVSLDMFTFWPYRFALFMVPETGRQSLYQASIDKNTRISTA
jgi:hypothetical protein